MLRVRDVMGGEVVSVPPSTSIVKVAQKMRDSGIGAIPVCHNGNFQGIVTAREIVVGVIATAQNPKREHIRSLMCNRHLTVSPDEEIAQAARMMVDHGVRVLPVAEDGKLLGLLTVEDLAREHAALATVVLGRTAKAKVLDEVAA